MDKQEKGSEQANQEQNLNETLKKLNLTAEQLESAVKAGIVIPKPKSLEELPEEVRQSIDKKIHDELAKSEENIKSQLYKTIEKQKSDLEKLQQAEAERERIKQEQEAERLRLEQEEIQKRMSLEEKLQQQAEAARKMVDELSSTYESKLKEITDSMRLEKLALLREKLIAENQVSDLDVFIPDPTKGQPATEESIRQAVELAKEKLAVLKTEKPTQIQSQNPGARVPSGDGHLRGGQSSFDEAAIARAGRSELDRYKEEAWKKYGHLFS